MVATRKNIILLVFIGLVGCAAGPNKSQLEITHSAESLQRHIYIGTGLGASRLEPDTSETSYDLNNRVDQSTQMTLGMDVNPLLSLELHAADLGSAGFSPSGKLLYREYGVSGLFHLGGNRSKFKRKGFKGYLRLGVGVFDNNTEDQIVMEQANPTHILTGAGAEYMFGNGLGLRAEGMLLDQDARYAQLAAVYRIGKKPSRPPIEIVKQPKPFVPPVAAVAIADTPEPLRTPKPIKNIQAPKPMVTKTSARCLSLNGELRNVSFLSSSVQLTQYSKGILNSIAKTLSKCEHAKVRVDAHTDSQGSHEFNFNLSKQRAISVAEYLVIRGLSSNRLSIKPYGETQPRDTNVTKAGRMRNRRVELVIQ